MRRVAPLPEEPVDRLGGLVWEELRVGTEHFLIEEWRKEFFGLFIDTTGMGSRTFFIF